MRKAFYLACCTMCLGLGVEAAAADVVTVNVTAHVTDVQGDPGQGPVSVGIGQTVTGTYSYDSSTPLSSDGMYYPAAPPAAMAVSVGSQTIQGQTTWTYQISVSVGSGSFPNTANFDYRAIAPRPAGQMYGSGVMLHFGFSDNANQWPASTALPTNAPTISDLTGSHIEIFDPNSGWKMTAQVDSVAQVPALTISPSTSSFLPQQGFDAVVLLSAQLPITSMQASVAGTPIPLSYPGTCQLAAPNNAGRAALVCPNAAAVLAALGGGPTTINWQVVLGDGSVLQQSVVWNLIQ